jgi:DNA-binding CsgD family transcriptional regulator
MLRVCLVGSKRARIQTESMLGADAWPMMGREIELDLIAGVIGSTRGAGGVAITGAMGVGKSRLASEALAGCKPASVRRVAGSSAAQGIPLGAFVRWLPPDAANPLHATNQVIAELVDRTPGQRCCVVVDDAHLLDDTSAFMLEQLIDRRLADVVLTVTSGVAVSDAVAALWRDGRLHRVEVPPLDRAECAELLERVLGGPVDPVSERQLWSLTRGNCRFLRHIIEQEVHTGRLRRNHGTWSWTAGAAVPSAVCELIEHRLGDLPEAVAETVDLLSVAEPLPPQLLVDLVGAAPMEEAERRCLITVEDGDNPMVHLAHPLYGKVRQLKAGHIRLRRLRGILASRLDAAGDPSCVLRRGALLLESDIAVSADDMLSATEAALWHGDSALALRFADAALSAGGGWRASLARAEALTMAGRLSEAHSTLAVDDAPPDADVELSVSIAKAFFLQRQTKEAGSALQWGQSRPGCASVGTGQVQAMRAFLAACACDLGVAGTSADAALGCVDLPDLSALLAITAEVIAKGETGRVDELEATVKRAHALDTRSTATSYVRFLLAEAHSSALQLAGYPDDALALIDGLMDDDQPPDVHRWLTMMTGSVSLASGEVDTAVKQLRDALSPAIPSFLGGWLYRYDIDLAIAHAIRGESDAAKQRLDRIESSPHPDLAFTEPLEMLARAWISASMGAVKRAIAEARAAAVTAATLGLPAREVLCLQTATRFGDDTTVARLDELVHVVAGRRAAVAAAHASALAAGDGDGLMAASGRYIQMGDALSALDAAAQAATVFRRAGLRGSALNATGRAHAMAKLCGDVHTPAVVDAAAPPVFTGREREVIMLVGSGLTNREIAERLQLSIRTVEGHLYRAAGRVGARDRNELARTIGDALAVPA